MRLAVVLSRSTLALAAPPVRVEVHISEGLPKLTIVGLAETTVKESKERVRAAIQNARMQFPTDKRVTINLAPADLPKEGGGYDLPIALGILAAFGKVKLRVPNMMEFSGELALDGSLHPVRGGLPMALAAHAAGHEIVLPVASAADGALVEGARVWSAATLAEVVAHLKNQRPLVRATRQIHTVCDHGGPDLADVQGQAQARRALEVAAAGSHSLLMIGPPGTGKTMLAQRLPGLLPPLAEDEALENASLHSLRGARIDLTRWRQPPFRAPHHTASAAALAGGGRVPVPGELSLAHRGVLFLDELPEFNRQALEVLRQPLESGQVAIARVAGHVIFPAQVQLVAAMNPCPCGYYGDPDRDCRCSDQRVVSYLNKVSGPLLDRIDMHVQVPRSQVNVLAKRDGAESSTDVRERVLAARGRQLARGGLNARLSVARLQRAAHFTGPARETLRQVSKRLQLSARAQHKVLRLARTIADLAAEDEIDRRHVAEAVVLRCLERGNE